MKGFPNQVSDLLTLARALGVVDALNAEGQNPRDDGVLGEALVRRGVLGTGHRDMPVEEYLSSQKARAKKSDQSYRTRARGLRELFRLLGLIDQTGTRATVTTAGKKITGAAGETLTAEGIRLWRNVIVGMTHDGGDGEHSHPYQVLLRLVARCPGITRAKCALALEAKNDSDAELDRIVRLSGTDEAGILEQTGVTESNWGNAKKILPRFAEELGDVQKVGGRLFLADAPGVSKEAPEEVDTKKPFTGARAPRSARSVTAGTIAKAGTTEAWDEAVDLSLVQLAPEALRARKASLMARLKRHNTIVRKVAQALEFEGADLFEDPFDCLACFPDEGLLIEVKTLDGTPQDEVDRVRDALGQLLYYESFVTRPLVKKRAVRKVACFESRISDGHIKWLESCDILVIWNTDEAFDGTDHAREELGGHLGF
jgi:hypothetical protein